MYNTLPIVSDCESNTDSDIEIRTVQISLLGGGEGDFKGSAMIWLHPVGVPKFGQYIKGVGIHFCPNFREKINIDSIILILIQ